MKTYFSPAQVDLNQLEDLEEAGFGMGNDRGGPLELE